MNILYCGDAQMEKGLFLSALSLAKHTSEALNIFVLTMRLGTDEKSFQALSPSVAVNLEELLQEINPLHRVQLLDVTTVFQEQPPVANMQTRFTPYCMLRLYADLLPELPERILYLDTDVLARKDFAAFYQQDLTDIEVVGALDYYGQWFFKNSWLSIKNDYLNSGVLLLNLAAIRESGLFARCRTYCQENELFMPDQSALNKCCQRKRIVSRRFNEQRKLHADTIFQHFTTSFRFFPWFRMVTVKPWEEERMHDEMNLHDYDDLYDIYQEFFKERVEQ